MSAGSGMSVHSPVELKQADLTAIVDRRGAYLKSLTFVGEHLLQPFIVREDGSTRGGAFVADPVYGPSDVYKDYGIRKKHSSSRETDTLVKQEQKYPNFAEFTFDATQRPERYARVLSVVSYFLTVTQEDEPLLECNLSCANNGVNPVPIAPGWHPYFPGIFHPKNDHFDIICTNFDGVRTVRNVDVTDVQAPQLIDSSAKQLEFRSGNGNWLIEMSDNNLAVAIAWSDDPQKYGAIEPTRIGALSEGEKIPAAAFVQPGETINFGMTIAWRRPIKTNVVEFPGARRELIH